MDPWGALGGALLGKDVNYGKVVAAKKALKLLGDNQDALVKLCLACADNDNFQVKSLLGGDKSLLNEVDSQGLTPLIYAVCFDKRECIDMLLALGADPSLADTLVGWTPIIWATYFEYVDAVESLLSAGADPTAKNDKTGKSAIDSLKPGSKIYEYYKVHGYIKKPAEAEAGGSGFYKEDYVPTDDDGQLGIATAGIADVSLQDEVVLEDRERRAAAKFVEETDEFESVPLAFDEFDFNVVLDKQCLKYTDDSLSQIVDYVFDLFKKYPNKPLYAATVIFMSLRYADNKLDSPESVDGVWNLFLTHVRSVTGTKSGAIQLVTGDGDATQHPDIVTIGYWLACLNHLYYFLSRDVCGFVRKYPKMLQEIVSTFQPLVAQIAFTIDARLDGMIDDCLLNYNSVPDLNIVYKRDWRFFNRQRPEKTTYEEIVDMLYPPALEEQGRPSPLRVIQTLGALLYVMELYHINDEITQQCFATVLYWLSSSVFNRVLARRRYCSRSKALQIRLNLSYIQDWLRTNDILPFKPDDFQFKDTTYPDTLVDGDGVAIQGVARFHNKPTDPNDGTFYFNTLFKIGRYLFAPTIELLEWLQVMTHQTDVSNLKETISNFKSLDSAQLLQTTKQYNYEIDEPKFAKNLTKWLKQNPFNAKVKPSYASADKTFLNVGLVFPLALPCYMQLLHQYGMDVDGMNERKVRLYQPNIPVTIEDDLDEIIDKAETRHQESTDELAPVEKKVFEDTRTSDLFKDLAPPTSLAHKDWSTSPQEADGDANPWA